MRTRKKAITRDQLTHYDNYVCTNPENYRSKWHEYFSNDNKIYVELGTGRGKFLITLAQRNPHINYIGLEMKEPLIFDAVFRAQNMGLNNIAFLHYNGVKHGDGPTAALSFQGCCTAPMLSALRLTNQALFTSCLILI